MNERKLMVERCELISASDCFIDMFDSTITEEKFMKLGKLWAELKTFKVYASYKSHLLQYTNLRSYLEAGMSTTTEKYIVCFLWSTSMEEESKFNTVCQKIMTNLLHCLPA